MKIVGKRISSLAGALLLMLTSGHVLADDSLRLVLQVKQSLLAGTVKDGASIGHGILVSREAHTGFRLWSGTGASLSQPGHYVLTGKQSGAHQLRIRLVPRGLSTVDKPGSADVLLDTGDDRIVFDVLVDGDQKVAADRYMLGLRAALK